MTKNIPINHEAWARNAVTFIRERGLEQAFKDWSGGFPCPIGPSPSEERYRQALKEIASADHIDLALDPTWPQRIADAALSPTQPEGGE